jgi:predicted deacylase
LEVRREIGRIEGASPGPTLVVVAGMHGNEPAGMEAARRVLLRLAGAQLRGEILVLAGNVEAMRAGVRYRVKDLNRLWTESRMAELRALPESARDAEDREQAELAAAIEAALGRARGRVHLCDLHTTSAAGIPFVLFGDSLAQLRFARVFPIPIILGLEERVDGVLTSFWTRRGCVTAAAEGGQHADPATIESLAAVLWLALAQAGLIEASLPEVRDAGALLETQRKGVPCVLEVLSRRAVSAADEFRMEPGFRNIDRVRKGQLLARDRSGEIRAPHDGVVIMPLYQGLGGDGFFWGREVSPVRLWASRLLRLVMRRRSRA